ncbi:glycosyltransferase [Oscillibacter valericigenes]|uniref:glycosyltransferase n=1 Tax=Oscillibacter valericigenes TaxID=351091 RepID=UPI001F44809C|nr:glycosyltransferase [Oscillibacter valericigenes]MCF2618177.1 glycosyltransferase [Oscillibacter valericigenes]
MEAITKKKDPILLVREHQYQENPKVSVIVPVYKVDKYLTQCLNSIVNQTMEELEIIIVDEGDQDRCREIIDYFEAHDPRIIAPHQKNGGYGASCNLGMSMARGEYIAIVESDDFIEPEMYEEMYEYAKALDADVVKTPYSEYFASGEKHDCSYRKYVASAVPSNMCFSVKQYGALMEIHASLWSGLYRTSYMRENKIQFIQAKGGAYVDVGFRIDTLIHSEKIAWLDKPYYNYRVDSEGSTTNNFKIGPMIQRWKEEHEMYAEIQEDYNNFYGPHIIIDEYYNTIGWLSLMKVTDDEFKAMQTNMGYVEENVIKNSPCLTEKQKGEILLFKNDPEKFKQYAAKNRFKNKYGNKIIGFFDRLSNFTLMKYLLASLIACVLSVVVFPIKAVQAGVTCISGVLLIGIAVCFVSKVIRVLLRMIFNR